MPDIEIEDETGLKFIFELKDASIALKAIRIYIPTANGLTYQKDNKRYILNPENDLLELVALKRTKYLQ